MDTESLTNQQLFVVLVLTIAVAYIANILFFTEDRMKGKVALSSEEFRKFKLVQKETVGKNTRRFTFALQDEETRLGLPIGQHVAFRFTDSQGKTHQRSYTPVSGKATLGTVSFIIKIYRANENPKYPEGGKMSQHLDSLLLGDTQDMKGPKGHLNYLGNGRFRVKEFMKPMQTRQAKRFGMIAGGTGITPMLQILRELFEPNQDESITVSLLYANQTEEDIIIRDELEVYATSFPHRFKIHYTLDHPPANWKYSTGFISKEMIEEHLPPPEEDGSTQVLMCGPGPMIRHACIPNLKELGFKETDYTAF